MMSTNTQAISDEVNAAKMRFDAACRDWGWQADQGYDGNAISASYIEYRAASDALSAAIAKAIHDAVMAERERCARLMEDDGEWTFAGEAAAMAIFEDVRELAADAIRAAPKSEG